MAGRVRVPITVVDVSGNVVSGATVQVQDRSLGANTTLYQAEIGATTVSNPTTTDSYGRVNAWVGRGEYNAIISGTGITNYTQPFEASPAVDGAGESAWLADPTWITGASIAASVPSPINGQEVKYLADATNGIVWHFKYRSASASAYKWEYIGGTPLRGFIATTEATASTSYVNLTTTGPSVTAPLTGDYTVYINCQMGNDAAGGGTVMSYAIGASAAADADAATGGYAGTAYASNVGLAAASRIENKLAIAAATAFVAKYRVNSTGNAKFGNRELMLTPIRVA